MGDKSLRLTLRPSPKLEHIGMVQFHNTVPKFQCKNRLLRVSGRRFLDESLNATDHNTTFFYQSGFVHMKRLRTAFFLASTVLLTSSCNSTSDSNTAPDIEAKLIDGADFKLADLKGKYVVIDFWGSWCAPCLHEMPALVSLHQKYGDKVEFVTIALEKNDRGWQKVSERYGFQWQYQIVETTPIVLASEIARDYGVTDIPATFIVAPDGKLIKGMDLRQVDSYLQATLQ